MSAFVFAHLGHWTTALAFFGPVVILPLGLYAVVLLDRRREDGRDESGPG